MILSILIPTIARHRSLLGELCISLVRQQHSEVEVLMDDRENISTGTKRNDLLKRAQGFYTVFVDSDDSIADDYIYRILKAADGYICQTKDGIMDTYPDAIVFTGIITTNGRNPMKFRLSKDYPYQTVNGEYLRYPNHIVPIKRSITTQFRFPDKTYGEDYEWATQIHQSGLIKTETKIEKDLYFYKYVTLKR